MRFLLGFILILMAYAANSHAAIKDYYTQCRSIDLVEGRPFTLPSNYIILNFFPSDENRTVPSSAYVLEIVERVGSSGAIVRSQRDFVKMVFDENSKSLNFQVYTSNGYFRSYPIPSPSTPFLMTGWSIKPQVSYGAIEYRCAIVGSSI